MALPKPGSVTDLINNLLDRGYNSTVQPVLSAVANSTTTGLMQRRLDELQAEAERLATAGEKLDPQNPILRALLADMETTMQGNARLLDTAAAPLQSSAGDAAATIQRQLALPGVTDAQLTRLGIGWNRPDPEAIARLVQYAQSDAWQNELARYGSGAIETITNQAIRGIVSGWGPIRTAREITRLTQTIPTYQANNLLRTLQLTAYRDATAANQTANRDIAQRVIRIAALDLRTCLACIDQHGEVLWDSETSASLVVPRVNDHHSGRCTSFIEIKGYSWNIQRGSDWFASLPPERQRQQASFASNPGKYEAYASGQLQLSDFVGTYHDPVFGDMLREASLKGALNGGSRTISTPTGVAQFSANALTREDALRQLDSAGIDSQQFETDIYNWRLLDYSNIRDAQTSDISEWADPAEYRELIRTGNNIEAGLRVLPKYDGTIYRALDLQNLDDMQGGSATVGNVLQMQSTSSFTRSLQSKFIDYSDEYNVVLRAINNASGVAVENIGVTSNSANEAEVIVPSQTAYRITGLIDRSTLPKSNPLYADSGWIIDMEEIK